MKKKKTNNSAIVAFVNLLAIDSLTHDIMQIEHFILLICRTKKSYSIQFIHF